MGLVTVAPYTKSAEILVDVDWGLERHEIPEQWAKSKGKGIVVYVFDTGTPRHSFLEGRTIAERNFSRSSRSYDIADHHTNCASIVLQWAPEVVFVHVKVLGDDGRGSSDRITAAYEWALSHWESIKKDYICAVWSSSLGGGYDSQQDKIVRKTQEPGRRIIFFAAAGNSGANAGIDSPGDSAGSIPIAAYQSDGKIAPYSSGGRELAERGFALPGSNILIATGASNQWTRGNGTSYATPGAAGGAALMIASRPNDEWLFNNEGVRKEWAATVRDAGPVGPDNRFGIGKPVFADEVRDNDEWFV